MLKFSLLRMSKKDDAAKMVNSHLLPLNHVELAGRLHTCVDAPRKATVDTEINQRPWRRPAVSRVNRPH